MDLLRSRPNSSEHELLKTRCEFMNAAEVVIFDNNPTGGHLDAERIATSIPADHKNALHRPTARWSKLTSELRVPHGKAHDVIKLIRAKVTAAACEKEPAIVVRNWTLGAFEFAELFFTCLRSPQRLRHRLDVRANLFLGSQREHLPKRSSIPPSPARCCARRDRSLPPAAKRSLRRGR